MIRFLIALLALLFLPSAWSAFHNYDIEDGLSQSVVFDIVQDQQGFMWFSTQAGLNRYDGNEFTVFTASDETNSLANNYIYPLALDSESQLFIGTRNSGVNQLALHNYQFSEPLLKERRITSLLVAQQHVYIGTYDGSLFRYDKRTQQLERLITDLKKPIYALSKIADILWIGTHGAGLLHYDLINKQQINTIFSGFAEPIDIHASIFAIKQAADGSIWLASQGGGLYKIELSTKTMTQWLTSNDGGVGLSSNEIRDIEFDSQGQVWLATRGGGINVYDPINASFTVLAHDPFDKYSLAHNRVYSIYRDSSDIMWFGTANGISKLDPASLQFSKLKKPAPLSSNDAWALFEDSKQRIWYGSWGGGIDILEQQLNRLERITTESSPYSISSNAIKAIAEDRNGDIWIGSWQQGIDVLHTDGSISHFRAGEGEHGLTENSIYALLVDEKNNVWVGTNGGGLFCFDRQRGKFISFAQPVANTQLIIPTARVTSLYKSSQAELWIGTDGDGAYHYNAATDTLTNYRKGDLALSDNTVRAFLEIDQQMWLATSNGLNIIDLSNQQVHQLNVAQGLPNQVVYALLKDNDDWVWLSTNNGLAKIDPATMSIKNYKARHGLQGNEFNAGAYLKTRDGRLMFGGTQGVSVINPADLEVNTIGGQLALTSLQFDDEDVVNEGVSRLGSLYQIEKSRSVTIPAGIKRVHFQISYLHYSEPQTNLYSYQLAGFEQQWRKATGPFLSVDYTNLPAGKYQLKVNASSESGANVLTPLLLNITVLAPWWQTSEFYLLAAMLILAMVWLFTVLWTRRIRKQKYYLEQIVSERTDEIAEQKTLIEQQAEALSDSLENKVRFFTHASHELRTPLSLLIAPLQKLIADERITEKREQLNLVLRNSRRLENLVDKLLTLTRYDERHEEIIKVVSLSAIAREVAGQFAVLGEKSIDFKVDIEEAVFIESTREGVITILTNLLSNAFKYTQQGQVGLTVSVSGELANIEVTDTGKGIADAEKGKVFDTFYRVSSHANVEGSGVGLAIVKRLVDKYKGTLVLASRLGEGTCFKLSFQATQFAAHASAASISLKSNEVQNKASVLIIEDNDELRHYLKSELQHRYQVLLAQDGQVGLQIALSQVPDLIITDLMMPKVDGFTVLDSLHNSPVTCHIPVIILTAKGDYETRVSSLQQHALDVITKPFDREELFLKIENWLGWVAQYAQQSKSEKSPHKAQQRTAFSLDPRDKKLLEKLAEYVAEHFHQQGFSMLECAKHLALSERQFQRKLKVLLNITPSEYLREYRLQRAAELLQQGRQVSLVIDDVGFSSRSYFSKFFKEKYGVTAKEYQCQKL